MKQQIISEVIQQMLSYLDNVQIQRLQKVLENTLFDCEITAQTENKGAVEDNTKLIDDFVSAKRIEGCSEKTLKYYRTTIEKMVVSIDKGIRHIQTEDLRSYLTDYQNKNQSSRVTIDNIRRILSSFFSWLEDEDYILKSPVRRIHKVKTAINIKETYTDEDLEKMRDSCTELRDLAMIDMLASTGMRIGDDDDKIRLNQRKPSKYKGLSRFGPEKNLQRINKFMKERPTFYKKLIQMKENFRFYLRCFYCITKVVILQFNSEKQDRISS